MFFLFCFFLWKSWLFHYPIVHLVPTYTAAILDPLSAGLITICLLFCSSLIARSSSTEKEPSHPSSGQKEWKWRISLFINSQVESQCTFPDRGKDEGLSAKIIIFKIVAQLHPSVVLVKVPSSSKRENFWGTGMNVRPLSNRLICANDGINTLERFKIFEEEDQLKSGLGPGNLIPNSLLQVQS